MTYHFRVVASNSVGTTIGNDMTVTLTGPDREPPVLSAIPDVTIPLPNLWYLIQWPTSGRKMTFTASKVQMQGKPTSCSQVFPVPLAMMTCGDPITVPLSLPIVNSFTNPLTVGITMADFLMGAAKAIVSLAINFVFDKYGPKIFGDKGPSWAGAILGKLGLSPGEIAKRTVNALAGLAFSAAEGNPTFKVELGGGPVPKVGVQMGGKAGDPGRFGEGTVAGVPVSGVWGNAPVDETKTGVQLHDTLNILGD